MTRDLQLQKNHAVSGTKSLNITDMGEKYLTFELANEEYALEILKVQEIIGMMSITHVPRMPEFIKGVINLRGKVIPVIDLRIQFSMEVRDYTERTCIIVVQVEGQGRETVMGVIVDEVYEVIDIDSDQIDPPPSFGKDIQTDFIIGLGKVGDKVITILDIDKVLTGNEIGTVDEIVSENM